MISYALKKSRFNIIIIILTFINVLINRNINDDNIIINLFIIDQISYFVDFYNLINKAKRKRRRDNNLYFYDKCISHVVVNCLLKRIVEKRKVLFRSMNVFLTISNIFDLKNI